MVAILVKIIAWTVFLSQLIQFILAAGNLAVVLIRRQQYPATIEYYQARMDIISCCVTMALTFISMILFCTAHPVWTKRLWAFRLLRICFEIPQVVLWTLTAITWVGSNYGFCRDNGGCLGDHFGGRWNGPGGSLMATNGDILITNAGLSGWLFGVVIIEEIAGCVYASRSAKRAHVVESRDQYLEDKLYRDSYHDDAKEERGGIASNGSPAQYAAALIDDVHHRYSGKAFSYKSGTTLPAYEAVPM